jgi:hydroxypyruvate reductase
MSLEAAAAVARNHGITPVILGDSIEGEARDVALVHAGIARQVAKHGQPARPPCVLLSGGETTVTVRGNGRGGRNAEFLLALAIALDGHPGIYAMAGDTDGVDGTEDNAGALLAPDSLERAAAAGVNARAQLANNDGYGFFSSLGDLVMTGPTLTNVNDFRAVLIAAPQ